MAVKDENLYSLPSATGLLGLLTRCYRRQYPTDSLILNKARKHYRIPVRSQYVVARQRIIQPFANNFFTSNRGKTDVAFSQTLAITVFDQR